MALESVNATGWEVIVSDKYPSTTIKGDLKKVFVPTNKTLSKSKLLGSVAGEIFTKVKRRVASESLFPYKILQSGLNGYLEAQEAIAKFSEAAFDTDTKIGVDGGDMHFGTCLALGLDGKNRDFKDVYHILYSVKFLKSIKKGADLEKAVEDAKNSAWKTSLKIFRGTPGNIPGICFRKDMVYGEGVLQLIKYLEEHKGEDISHLWEGRYSPWNPEHMAIVSKFRKS
jgi:hypothetical protein